MAMSEVVRLRRADKKRAAKAFARAFFEYPMITCFFPGQERRARYLAWYMGCMIEYGFRYGEVYTTPDIAGVAVWLPPGQTYCTTWRYILSGFLPAPLVTGLRQYAKNMLCDDLLLKVHRESMPGPHWYLFAVGVDPDWQGRGIGKSLLQAGLERADGQNLPCYLETHDEKDIAFYEKYGFSVVRQEQVPGVGLRFWCMRRDPARS